MFKREVDGTTGDHVLRYRGPGKWIGRLYGYGLDVFYAVSSRELPYPEDLRSMTVEAGISPDKHPLITPFRIAVIDALMAEALVQAPELLAEYVALPLVWSEPMGLSLEREHVRALERVRSIVDEWKRDLQRRMRTHERFAEPVIIEPVQPEPVVEEPKVVPVPQSVLTKIHVAIGAAREAELPQRLPSGVRRLFSKLPSGVYLVEGKDISPSSNLETALSLAKTRAVEKKSEIVVVDFDSEWPVVVRKFGSDGTVVYKVEAAVSRAGIGEGREKSV